MKNQSSNIRIIATSRYLCVDHITSERSAVAYLRNLRDNFITMVRKFDGSFAEEKMIVQIIKQ